MATRRETQNRRIQLRQSLIEACRDGSMAPGDVLPPLTELAKECGLSVPIASQVIKQLVDEGVLYTLHGSGTFVGRQQQGNSGIFLLIVDENVSNNPKQMLPMKVGFEERITQIGGTSLTLTYDQIDDFLLQDQGLTVEGIFNFFGDTTMHEALAKIKPTIPQVFFGDKEHNLFQGADSVAALSNGNDAVRDWVSFDNNDGGYQATRHLLNLRHHRIAFLGLHGSEDESRIFSWSRERQKGWELALKEKGHCGSGLAFAPTQTRLLGIDEQWGVSYEVAQQMIPLVWQSQISAVVAANCHAARGFFQALSVAKVPQELWPAVVCFGEAESTGEAPSVVTEMSQPWEGLGREAANLLWSRRNYVGEPRQALVKMRLISRLSCKANWQTFPKAVTLALQYI